MTAKKSLLESIFHSVLLSEDAALNHAVANKKSDKKIDRLLEIGADPYQEGIIGFTQTTPFCQASKSGNLKLMDKFLNADCTKRVDQIIGARRAAVKAHRVDSITHLFGKGYSEDLDVDRLIAASTTHDEALLKELFENNIPTQSELDNCFIRASEVGILDNVIYFKNLGADVQADNGTDNALTAIARGGRLYSEHNDIRDYLKDNGFPMDKANPAGESAAEIAASQGNESLTLKISPEFPLDQIKTPASSDMAFASSTVM
jgi:ankyrin repeat protein